MKIIDKRVKKDDELPKLPFFTFNKCSLFMFFHSNGYIKYVNMKNGNISERSYTKVADAVNDLDTTEQIVKIEIHIVD